MDTAIAITQGWSISSILLQSVAVRSCSSIIGSVEGGGGVPQMLTFAHKGGRGGTANDHSIMIMHWGEGGGATMIT